MEKRKIENFEDLRVWQRGIELTKQIYIVTGKGELSRDFGLKDQLRRAVVSVPTNVAEGFERRSRKEYVNFLSLGARSLAPVGDAGSHRNIAKGSVGEVRSLLRVAIEVGYLEEKTYLELHNQAKELSRMLASQIKAINRSMQ